MVAIHPMAASHGLQVAVQSVKAMPDNKVPEIWGESVTQQGAKIAVELVRWSLRMCAQNDERKAQDVLSASVRRRSGQSTEVLQFP